MIEEYNALYRLLPAIYRVRDEEQGEPLSALLGVVASQAALLKEDIAGLYENWFIETCEDWVVPYIAGLVGYRPVRAAGEPGPPDTPQGRLLNNALIPRREIANTIRLRRSKGTLAALEQLAHDVTGWTARAVESYDRVALLTPVGQARPGTAGVSDAGALSRLGIPFDTLARTVDVRSAAAGDGPAQANLHGVRLYVWRLRAYSVTRSQPCDKGNRRYTFSALGLDTPLFIRPEPEAAPTDIAGELNTPSPLRRQTLVERRAALYGANASFCLYWQIHDNSPPEPVPPGRIVVADLSRDDWSYRPLPDQPGLDLSDWGRALPTHAIAVDPELGRILLPPQPGYSLAYVSYHYGFSADIGGGEYHRKLAPAGDKAIRIRSQMANADQKVHPSVPAAIAVFHDAARPQSSHVVEFVDSDVYREVTDITVPRDCRFELRAANGCRPVIDLRKAGAWIVRGEPGSTIVLDGLLIHGGTLIIEGCPRQVEIRHTTIVPSDRVALLFRLESGRGQAACDVRIESSIVGRLQVDRGDRQVHLTINDSIIDAQAKRGDFAILDGANMELSVARSTLLGIIGASRVRRIEDTICNNWIWSDKKPEDNAVRFSTEQFTGISPDSDPSIFLSTRYGDPRYCRLAPWCPPEIARGASDSSEMGVYHNLFLPQREAILRARLEEYTVMAMEAALCFAD